MYIFNNYNRIAQFYIYICFVLTNKKRIVQNYLLFIYLYITIANTFNKSAFIITLSINNIKNNYSH